MIFSVRPGGCAGPRVIRFTLQPRERAMKTKLNLDSVAVESFETGGGTAQPRGTVQAHQASGHCNTRQPFCQLPSVNIPCITDEVECG
jgi:hypothetical protein